MIRRFTYLAVPLLFLAACEEREAPAPLDTPAPPPVPTPQAKGSQPAPLGGAREVSERTDLFLFEYSYPQAAGETQELARWLDSRLERERNRLAARAEEGRNEARDNGFPFNAYSSETAWEVVADLPDWLSMSAELSSYSGGAHPNYGFDTIVWNKERGAAMEPIAFFTSPQALDAAIGQKLCDALNAERAKRRGEAVPEGSDDTFDTCIKPDETNLLLGSTNGQSFNRIGIQIAPYLAGPYAEGSYEFTFPVTPEVLETVQEEYRDVFSAS
ncbi:DUF4163 domain-containing protein [Aurantiacibacter poecillastricola]|uniref:DUF4163 domain-containing protein n=1 Tax=Aurantiacibacter poecillastricola TaxID=3064385 RepID=UPI00273EC547|nr:DUF4163 domain-containing protein [Aurantiacibacter sp. 219JJ12-13]MDP5262861.1 DUF4163 domain-containing protein [Aurantiacibacter sp. 219JJ12-13]